jgi:hypothetical protein
MWFKAKETLGEDQVQYALRYVIRNGVASQAMGILTGGAFRVAFAVKLGASNFVIGLYALHRLAMVKEAGEVEESIVVRELFTEVRTQIRILSSIEGVRQIVSFPLSILRNLAIRNRGE